MKLRHLLTHPVIHIIKLFGVQNEVWKPDHVIDGIRLEPEKTPYPDFLASNAKCLQLSCFAVLNPRQIHTFRLCSHAAVSVILTLAHLVLGSLSGLFIHPVQIIQRVFESCADFIDHPLRLRYDRKMGLRTVSFTLLPHGGKHTPPMRV